MPQAARGRWWKLMFSVWGELRTFGDKDCWLYKIG